MIHELCLQLVRLWTGKDVQRRVRYPAFCAFGLDVLYAAGDDLSEGVESRHLGHLLLVTWSVDGMSRNVSPYLYEWNVLLQVYPSTKMTMTGFVGPEVEEHRSPWVTF